MAQQDFQLNDNANFVFQYENKVYKLGVNVINGVITLEKLKKDQRKRDFIKIITLPNEEPTTEVEESSLESSKEKKQPLADNLETTEEK